MRKALGHLPWVEQNTIKADRDTKKVRFGVNDKEQFSEEALREALPARYRTGLKVVKNPA